MNSKELKKMTGWRISSSRIRCVTGHVVPGVSSKPSVIILYAHQGLGIVETYNYWKCYHNVVSKRRRRNTQTKQCHITEKNFSSLPTSVSSTPSGQLSCLVVGSTRVETSARIFVTRLKDYCRFFQFLHVNAELVLQTTLCPFLLHTSTLII
jgi:hypothetical protein